MPADAQSKSNGPLPSPWKEFLSEIDSMLKEPLQLHCIGGFVICYFYGLPRVTGDIDYYTAVPANLNLLDIAVEGSELSNKYKITLHHVAIITMPEDYDTRLTEMFPGMFKQLRLLAPDPYDYILSKLERNTSKDRDDADYLFRTQNKETRFPDAPGEVSTGTPPIPSERELALRNARTLHRDL